MRFKFDEVHTNFDALFARPGKQQENLVLNNQIKRVDDRTENLEARVEWIEKKVAWRED